MLFRSVAPQGPSTGVLKTGDVLVGLDGVAVDSPHALFIRTAEIPVGRSVVVRFYRNGGIGEANVTMTTPPPPLDESITPPTPPVPTPVILSALGLGLAGKPASNGVVSGVAVISAKGPAAKAGIVAGDVIEQVNGQNVATAADVQAQLKALGKLPPVFLVSGNTADGNNPGPRWVPVPAG